MVRIGAARLLPERDLTPDTLSVSIGELGADRAQMLKMATAARSARNVDAAARLADLCMSAGSARA